MRPANSLNFSENREASSETALTLTKRKINHRHETSPVYKSVLLMRSLARCFECCVVTYTRSLERMRHYHSVLENPSNCDPIDVGWHAPALLAS
jgi:hypothetical protein